jgi:TPR repeat protein
MFIKHVFLHAQAMAMRRVLHATASARPLSRLSMGSVRNFRVSSRMMSTTVAGESEFLEAKVIWNTPGKRQAAFALLQTAASLGHPPSTVIVGDAYLSGDAEIGVEKDEKKAFEHFSKASEAKYGPAYTKVKSQLI